MEFGLLSPLLVVMMFGTFELTFAFRMQAKLNTTAGTLADFVMSAGSITAPGGTLKDLCAGAKLNLLPYDNSVMTANVVSITNDVPANRVSGSTDTTTVTTYLDWEVTSDCGKDAANKTPDGLGLTGAKNIAEAGRSLLTKTGDVSGGTSPLQNGASAIVVQVNYDYSNPRTRFFGRSFPMTATAAVKPRLVSRTMCFSPLGVVCSAAKPL